MGQGTAGEEEEALRGTVSVLSLDSSRPMPDALRERHGLIFLGVTTTAACELVARGLQRLQRLLTWPQGQPRASGAVEVDLSARVMSRLHACAAHGGPEAAASACSAEQR